MGRGAGQTDWAAAAEAGDAAMAEPAAGERLAAVRARNAAVRAFPAFAGQVAQ